MDLCKSLWPGNASAEVLLFFSFETRVEWSIFCLFELLLNMYFCPSLTVIMQPRVSSNNVYLRSEGCWCATEPYFSCFKCCNSPFNWSSHWANLMPSNSTKPMQLIFPLGVSQIYIFLLYDSKVLQRFQNVITHIFKKLSVVHLPTPLIAYTNSAGKENLLSILRLNQ